MEIEIFKYFGLNIVVSNFDKISVTIHKSETEFMEYVYAEKISLKNLNLFTLKFLMNIMPHFDIRTNVEASEELQKISRLSGLFVSLNYNVTKELIVKFHLHVANFHKIFVSQLFKKEDEFLGFYSSIQIMRKILNVLINN